MASVLNQPVWGELEGLAEEPVQFEPTKQVVMIREVPELEADKQVVSPTGDIATASAGDFICYSPGEHLHLTLDEYDHCILSPWDFAQNYHVWDTSERPLSLTEQHLIELGCRPYYKVMFPLVDHSYSDDLELSNSSSEESFWKWLVNLIRGGDS